MVKFDICHNLKAEKERVIQLEVTTMKKITLVISCIVIIIVVLATGCRATEESWETIQGLVEIPEEYLVSYYEDYIEKDYPLNDVKVRILKRYESENPDQYKNFKKPLPVKVNGQDKNIILFSDEEGNIYSTQNGKITT